MAISRDWPSLSVPDELELTKKQSMNKQWKYVGLDASLSRDWREFGFGVQFYCDWNTIIVGEAEVGKHFGLILTLLRFRCSIYFWI